MNGTRSVDREISARPNDLGWRGWIQRIGCDLIGNSALPGRLISNLTW